MHNPATAENNHVVQKIMEKEVAATWFRSPDIGEGIVDMEVLEVSIEDKEGEEVGKMGEMTTPTLKFEDYNGEGIGALIKVNA